MSEKPKALVVDCQTGNQLYRDLTEDEIIRSNQAAEEARVRESERLAVESAENAARESARTKLAALGLTEAEVAALVK